MHLNRTAEVGALSASFAHEVSQPLVSIMLVAEAAERLLSAKPDHRLKEMLGKIRQADQQAVEIIQHLKKLLKRRSEVETKSSISMTSLQTRCMSFSPRRGIETLPCTRMTPGSHCSFGPIAFTCSK